MPLQLREPPAIDTLAALREEVASARQIGKVEDLPLSEVDIKLTEADPHFEIHGDTVPATAQGVEALASFFQIPIPYLKRVGKEIGQGYIQEMLTHHLDASSKSGARIQWTEAGLLSVDALGRSTFPLTKLVDVAIKTLGTDQAKVTRLVDMPTEFSFDVAVPEDYSDGVGGDSSATDVDPRIGDITTGGISLFYNRKLNATPTLASYLYRLACTNGMLNTDRGLQVDARGQTVDEVLAELEAMAQRAFSRVERQIEHFYEMRDQRIESPATWLDRIGEENGLSTRQLRHLHTLVASSEVPDGPSAFDLTNLVTNQANDPALIQNDGGRQKLEYAGGRIVQDDAIRCGHCSSRLA